MASKTKSFAQRVLANLNKDEATLQQEQVDEKVADFIIDCNTQITLINTGSIPKLNALLAKAKKELTKAKAASKNAAMSILNFDFEGLVQEIEGKKNVVIDAEAAVADIQREINQEEESLKNFQELLEVLKG
jgi:hypothetical protein